MFFFNRRAAISKEIAKLKECPQAMSPSARSSRISALENMLSSSSSAMVSMASQLSEAEERERAFNGKGRWNHVRSLPDAKNTMNYLFQLASSSRYVILCFLKCLNPLNIFFGVSFNTNKQP